MAVIDVHYSSATNEWHRRIDLIAAAKAYPELAELARRAEESL